MVEPLESRQLFAVNFPASPDVEFQTNGPSRPPGIGDWYTTDASASTDRAHYILVEVTADMLTAGGGTVGIVVNDAESALGAGPLDEIEGTPDPTRFRLLQSDRTTVIDSVTLASGSPNGSTAAFSVSSAGTYYVESVTGAGPISGDFTADLNDDDNAYSITVSQDGGLFGQFQATFQPNSAGDIELFFVVGPGTGSLFLRNFDLDGASVTYTRPSGATIAGTTSASGQWNGPSPTLNTGGDAITGLTAADAGIWKATISGIGIGNQAVFEPNDGAGRRIVIVDTTPASAGNFTIGNSGTQQAMPGVAVDHVFTVTNNFATSDAINLSTSGTAAGYTVQLLDENGVALTDNTGDGVVDTGVLQSGESRNFRLRVTPAANVTASDTTVVQAVSYLDEQIDGSANTVRSITLTSALGPAIAQAVVDYGFLRSRDAVLTGRIADGLSGPHRVRINWGDGKVSFVDLADGETAFRAEHRYKHGNRRRPVKLTVTNVDSGLTSTSFAALRRSQAEVIAVYRDALGRDPTSAELKRWSKKFDRCRSVQTFSELSASLRARLASQVV
jgi:hypothetical protein